MKQVEKKYHKLWGYKSFLKHDKPNKTIYCYIYGKSNIYEEKTIYPYVNYRPWNNGIIPWLGLGLGISLFIFFILFVIYF